MADVPVATRALRVGRLQPAKILRYIRRLPIIPIFVLALVISQGILAPWLSSQNPRVGELAERNMPPAWMEGGSTDHILGTDQQGRDIFTRINYGARISLVVAAVVLVFGGGVGTLLGLVSGWYGGLVDELIMRVVDIFMALPLVLIALVLVVALGPSFTVLLLVMGLWIWVRFARMARGEVLKLKEMDYVALAQVAGASTPRIIVRHLWPGVRNTVTVVATLQVGSVIILEASLSFLGAGIPPPEPAWGSMVAEGRDLLASAWWVSTIPGLVIMMTVLSLNVFGDWMRDTLDPKLRQQL
jgi:peptide/nickel transport system permease protein